MLTQVELFEGLTRAQHCSLLNIHSVSCIGDPHPQRGVSHSNGLSGIFSTQLYNMAPLASSITW